MLARATGDVGHYEAALDAARSLGMRPIEALCHLGLATLAARNRDGARLTQHGGRALEMLRAMDMRYWLAEAESALGARAGGGQSSSHTGRNP